MVTTKPRNRGRAFERIGGGVKDGSRHSQDVIRTPRSVSVAIRRHVEDISINLGGWGCAIRFTNANEDGNPRASECSKKRSGTRCPGGKRARPVVCGRSGFGVSV